MAVRVGEEEGIEPGVYFRIELGGITGHGSFSQDTGFMVRPEQCIAAAAAVIRIYLENGDRTNRKKARLKYLLDRWGVQKFMEAVQERLAFPLTAFPRERCQPRPPVVRHSHVGFHPQREAGRCYVGVVVPVGRMQTAQMRRLADVADRYGSGDLRLTVFQNLLIPDLREEDVEAVKQEILETGFHYETANVRSGLVACTGNAGCPYANTNTKAHARTLGDYLEERVQLDLPINIHFTGCPHSCAQHYCGDIGLLGTKVKTGGESVEGYHIVLGGGMDHDQGLARELFTGIRATDVPPLVEGVLNTYLRERKPGESFVQFTRRHSEAELLALFQTTETIDA